MSKQISNCKVKVEVANYQDVIEGIEITVNSRQVI